MLLEQPFSDQRAAVHRFIAALGIRSWFAAEVSFEHEQRNISTEHVHILAYALGDIHKECA